LFYNFPVPGLRFSYNLFLSLAWLASGRLDDSPHLDAPVCYACCACPRLPRIRLQLLHPPACPCAYTSSCTPCLLLGTTHARVPTCYCALHFASVLHTCPCMQVGTTHACAPACCCALCLAFVLCARACACRWGPPMPASLVRAHSETCAHEDRLRLHLLMKTLAT
jgi:hypothetical protein